MDSPQARPEDCAGPWRWLVEVRRGEELHLAAAFLFHFCLLASYYVLRPVRDEIGAHHNEHLDALWTTVFFVMLVVAPLYAWLVTRWSRRVFLPAVYLFLIVNILAFRVILIPPAGKAEAAQWAEWAFYVWASVFSLFAVSVFWGFMADLFRQEQGRRLFGAIAAGGTLGALTGSGITTFLVKEIGRLDLLVVSAGFLALAMLCIPVLDRLARGRNEFENSSGATHAPAPSLKGRGRAARPGMGFLRSLVVVFGSPYLLMICGYILLYSLGNTFLYMVRSNLVEETIVNRDARTAFLARIDLLVQLGTMVVQGLVVARLMRTIGVGWTLSFLHIVNGAGFIVLGSMLAAMAGATGAAETILWTLVAFETAQRTARYALSKPSREVLYTILPREEKYASKTFIDTVVYRGSDVANAWFFSLVTKILAWPLSAASFVVAPVVLGGVVISLALGHRQARLAREEVSSTETGKPGLAA